MAQSTIVLCPSLLWIGEIAEATIVQCPYLYWIGEMAKSNIVLCPSFGKGRWINQTSFYVPLCCGLYVRLNLGYRTEHTEIINEIHALS